MPEFAIPPTTREQRDRPRAVVRAHCPDDHATILAQLGLDEPEPT